MKFENEKDVKSIYRETRKLLKIKSGGPPKTFLKDGRLIRSPLKLAAIQLEFYNNKIQALMRSLPATQGDPLRYLRVALQRWNRSSTIQSFEFREVSTLETVEMISKLGNTTACGLDEVDARAIKLVAESLTLPIKHMINVSLLDGKFANKWKIAKTIPLLKNNDMDKLSPSSYRPVALLSTISKVVERAAQVQLLNFFEKTEQINPNCHAYRQGLSTTSTLIQIMDGLYEATEERKISSLMTVDQSCAFDCVQHKLLLEKLRHVQSGRKCCGVDQELPII